jgi:hypothetical protein
MANSPWRIKKLKKQVLSDIKTSTCFFIYTLNI